MTGMARAFIYLDEVLSPLLEMSQHSLSSQPEHTVYLLSTSMQSWMCEIANGLALYAGGV